jgi:hypothetical protein
MRLTFNVTTTDGETKKVSTAYADIIALEEKYGIDASDLASRQKAGWLAYLAWHALKRKNETTQSFDEFSKNLEVLEPEDTSGNE